MKSPVTIEVHDNILLVTLNRPKVNAIDVATSMSLYRAFADFENDPALRVAIITGAGDRFFSAGWDLKAAAHGEPVDADHGPGGFAGLTEYFDRSKPVIAAVNGLALGGGFELALACDLIVAAESAQFALPEVQLGIVADSGGAIRLPKRLPTAIATELLMTGRRMTAQEARSWGLINEVVAAGDLLDNALDLARRVALGAPLALAAIKELTAACEATGVADSFAVMRSGRLHSYRAMLASADAKEGPAAFAERRTPEWSGH